MSVTQSAKSTSRAGAAAGVLLALAAMFAVWSALYLSGAFPWLGYSWLSRDLRQAGVAAVAEERGGMSLGAGTFLFFAGQNVVVNYSADIRAGALWFYVYRPFDGVTGDGVAHYVTESGAGEWAVHIPQTGLYAVTIAPTIARASGNGWDLGYEAWWGARPG